MLPYCFLLPCLSMCSHQVGGPGLEFSLLSLDIQPWTNPIPPLWPLVSSFVKGTHNAILAPHRFLLRSTYVMDMQWLWNITCCSGCRALLIVLFLLVPLPEYFLAKLCISVICFIRAPSWVVNEIMTQSSLSRLDLTCKDSSRRESQDVTAQHGTSQNRRGALSWEIVA